MDWNKALLYTKLGIFLLLDLAGVIGTAGMTVMVAGLVALATNPVFGVCAAIPAFGAGMLGRRWVCGQFAHAFIPELKNETVEGALKELAEKDKKKDDE